MAIEDEEEADAELIASGRLTYTGPNFARDARKKLGLSQEDFAEKFGLSVRTLQDWEQCRREPDRPSKILLQVISEEPGAVIRALASTARKAKSIASRAKVAAR